MAWDYKNIIAVDVYIENRKTRTFAGRLTRDEKTFTLTYDDRYLHEKTAVSLGPELPLTKKTFTSKTLFPSLRDRIPSRENSAYSDYCAHFGIDIDERDELVLLSTIGRKGPSSFIFEPAFKDTFSCENLIAFRKKLDLSIRDFGALFDFSPSSLNKIEKGHNSGRDALKRLELYIFFPEVALYEMKKNRGKVHADVYRRAVEIIHTIIHA